MRTDLTLPAARADRDRLADRTGVLDKVGVLQMLPDDMPVATDAVAGFYQVDRETILTAVKRNRDELEDDGFRVIPRSEVTSMLNVTPDDVTMPRNAPTMSLFPRRAVLRIGMLLRDSPVARKVRDYLLDAERPTPVFTVPQTFAQALRLAADEHEAREQPKPRSPNPKGRPSRTTNSSQSNATSKSQTQRRCSPATNTSATSARTGCSASCRASTERLMRRAAAVSGAGSGVAKPD